MKFCVFSFVLGAVSPAVVVPSMLILQAGGYGVEKGVPTLLMAAGSVDDILAITGFNTCLGMAFSSGTLPNPSMANPGQIQKYDKESAICYGQLVINL